MRGQAGIPARSAAALVDEVLPFLVGQGLVGLVFLHGRQDIIAGLGEFGQDAPVEPAQQDPLLDAEVRRDAAFAVVAAAGHQREFERAGGDLVRVVIGVVEVRQAHGVAELVAGRADAAHLSRIGSHSFQLVGTGVAVDLAAVQRQADVGVRERPLVRPDGVFVF